MIELHIGAKTENTWNYKKNLVLEKKQLDSSINMLSNLIKLPFAETKLDYNLQHGNYRLCIPEIQISDGYTNLDDIIQKIGKLASKLPEYENIEDEFRKAQKKYEDKQFDSASTDFFNIYFVSSQFPEKSEFAIRSAIYLCEINIENKNVKEATVYALAAYNLSKNKSLDPNIKYLTALRMGEMNYIQGEPEKSIKCFEDAYYFSKSMENSRWRVLVLWEIVQIHFFIGQYKNAAEKIEELINIIQNDNDMKDDYYTLYDLRTAQTRVYEILITKLEEYKNQFKECVERLNKETSILRNIKKWAEKSLPSFLTGVTVGLFFNSNININIKIKDSIVNKGIIVVDGEKPIIDNNEKKVFLIHGQKKEICEEIRDWLKNQGLEPILLEEQASGKTIIEKFERFAGQCRFAIAVFSYDDIVINGGEKYAQARPNVILELGWFYERIGRDKTLIVEVEPDDNISKNIPSDIAGTYMCKYDSLGEYKNDIIKHLRNAGIL